MEIVKAANYRNEIVSLLKSEKLPVADLPGELHNFFVCLQDGETVGVVGVELYENYGLLRSLAVSPALRGNGVAGQLLDELERFAVSNAIGSLYLLTETAPEYFTRKGYLTISRQDVPVQVQQSSEFSHVCPQSAIVMMKQLITK